MTTIVTGGSSGLGAAIMQELDAPDLIDWSLNTGVDLCDSASVQIAADTVPAVDILINCAGVNEIDYVENTKVEDWDRVLNTNARAIFLTARALLPKLKGGTILNIVSNASHVPMTASIAYNASKAAAAIMTRQMARELGKTHNITVFGISPNKLKGTGMSSYIERRVQEVRGWTVAQTQAYQLAVLPAGEETDPVQLAEFIAFLLSSKVRHKFLAGCILEYGA